MLECLEFGHAVLHGGGHTDVRIVVEKCKLPMTLLLVDPQAAP